MWQESYHERHGQDASSFSDIPDVIQNEINRRKLDPTLPPASDEVQQALRDWFQSGGDPAIAGGYIDLMEKLGVTPKSTDRFVTNPDYNTWHFFLGHEDEQERAAWGKQALQDHAARVRLLRYGEYLKTIENNNKIGIPSDFHYADVVDEVVENPDQEDPTVSSLQDERNLTMAQIQAFAGGFVQGLYAYANHEVLYHGISPNSKHKDVAGMPPKYRGVEISISDQGTLELLQELADRYYEKKCPLGPPWQFETSKRSTGTQSHAAEIKKYIGIFLNALGGKIAAPTEITGSLYQTAFDMLSCASLADVDVAKALVYHKKTLFSLREKAIKYTAMAEADMTRPSLASLCWLAAYASVTKLFADVIKALTDTAHAAKVVFQSKAQQKTRSPNSDLAVLFFEKHVEPALLSSISSKRSWEKYCASMDFASIIGVLHPNVAKRVVSDKGTWKLLKTACIVAETPVAGLNRRQLERQNIVAPLAAAKAVSIFASLCQRSMVLEEANNVTNVAPGRLASKMLSRGVVPLVMDLAQSPYDNISREAVIALAHMSRIKDCRMLMFQHPRSAALVKDMLSATEGKKAGNAMLLVVHLLWDREWHESLFAIEGPSIEQVAARWHAHSMRFLCDKAKDLRIEEEEREKGDKARLGELCREKFFEGGSTTDARVDWELAELTENIKSHAKWYEVESMGYEANNTLRRSLLLLSGSNHSRDPRRLLEVKSLHLIACCIDMPDTDAFLPISGFFHNLMASMGRAISADMFPDPCHILRSMIFRLDSFAQANQRTQQTMIFMDSLTRFVLNNDSWKPYAAQVTSEDEMCRHYIQEIIPHVSMMGSAASRNEPDTGGGRVHKMYSNSCYKLTGKLGKCNGCGKMEGKRGEFSRCGRCKSAVYCGRDCQRKDWKKHKKSCASLG